MGAIPGLVDYLIHEYTYGLGLCCIILVISGFSPLTLERCGVALRTIP